MGATERNARAQAHSGKPRIRFRKASQLRLYGTIHQAQALGDSFGNRSLRLEGFRAQNGGVDRLRLMESFATAAQVSHPSHGNRRGVCFIHGADAKIGLSRVDRSKLSWPKPANSSMPLEKGADRKLGAKQRNAAGGFFRAEQKDSILSGKEPSSFRRQIFS